MHIARLEAHTTLNTYNLWKLALRGHIGSHQTPTRKETGIQRVNYDYRTRDICPIDFYNTRGMGPA